MPDEWHRVVTEELRREVMNKKWLAGFALVACVIVAGMSSWTVGTSAAAQEGSSRRYPTFEIDTTWPKLPNDMVFGNVSKVVIDSHQNVWIIHRPRTVAAGKKAAPPIVELDPSGKYLQGWGGPAAGYDWPDAEHNI